MDELHLSKDEWLLLEPELARAERHGVEEFFSEQPGAAGDKTTPGGLLLQHLIEQGDDEGLALFRAMEMLHHEMSRHGYAAAFRLGQEHCLCDAGGCAEGCCGCDG